MSGSPTEQNEERLYLMRIKFTEENISGLYTLYYFNLGGDSEIDSLIMDDDGRALFCIAPADAAKLRELAAERFKSATPIPTDVSGTYDLPQIFHSILNGYDYGGFLTDFLIFLLDYFDRTPFEYPPNLEGKITSLFGHIFENDGKIVSFSENKEASAQEIFELLAHASYILFVEGRIIRS